MSGEIESLEVCIISRWLFLARAFKFYMYQVVFV